MDVFNPATAFIDLFALLGWAYDLKVVPKQVLDKKKLRNKESNHIEPVVSRAHRSIYEWFTGLMVNLSPMFIIYFLKIKI